MTVGDIYRVATGTLTVKSVSAGKNRIFTLWYESDRQEYSREVHMTEESMKRTDNLSKKIEKV